MRILHTSDWHLGRSFHRADLLGHQAVYVDHLLEVVASQGIDLVVVSGDVYDRALPPIDAVRLADEAIARLAASGARVVISSGNHDSARRLGFGARVMDAAGVHVRTDPALVGTPILTDDRHGPVAIYALPYLDPDVARSLWTLETRSHEAALAAAMDRVRADLATRPGTRAVVLAHAFVAGAQPSDSERDISVGGVQRVPTSTFDGIDYVALGHLHGPHVLDDRMRYSGSPLAYSFSEAGQVKGSWVIELGAEGTIDAEFLPAPVPRPLARLRGTLDGLLADPALGVHESAWVEATLTDVARPRAAMERLRRRFPHALVLGFSQPSPAGDPAPRTSVVGRSAHDVTLDFVAHVRAHGADATESALLATACESCTGDADADAEQPPTGGARAGGRMRLHRLEISAFGPFATSAEIDFDALAAGGVFLLSGATGAGKSSVLDAVCFALYGQVPGERAAAKHLRSDIAAPDAAPRVVAELTLSEHRLRITRSPAWDRPKRRGEGVTRIPATVVLEEHGPDGAWIHLTGRIDEAGQLLRRLLGLTLDQFCQVVLLPQGGFQQFLRASVQERQRLLESIFRTRRYGDIEKWLTETRRERRLASLDAQRAIADVVSRLSESTRSVPPPTRFDLPGGDLPLLENASAAETESAGDDAPIRSLTAWVSAESSRAAAESEAASIELASAADAHAVALEAHAAATALAQRQRRAHAAQQAMAALDEQRGEVEAARVLREGAHRAAGVAGLIVALEEAQRRLVAAETAWENAVERVGTAANEALGTLDLGLAGEIAELDADVAERALTDLAAREHRCEQVRDVATSTAALRGTISRRAVEIARLADEIATLKQEREALPAALQASQEAARLSSDAAAGIEAADAALAAARRGVEASRLFVELTGAVEDGEAELATARAHTVAVKETWLEIAEQRVTGMAAELAHQLASGNACPVCGSNDHPAPAPSRPGAPDAAAEKAARRTVDDAEFAQQTLAEHLRTLREKRAAQASLAQDHDVAYWRGAADEARARVAELRAHAARAPQERRELELLQARAEQLVERLQTAQQRHSILQAEQTTDEAKVAEADHQLVRVLRDEGAETLDAALMTIAGQREAWRHLAQTSRERSHRAEGAQLAEQQCARAAADAGFDSVDAARSAVLPAGELERLELVVRDHEDRLSAASATLGEEEIVAALTHPPADVRDAAEAREAAESRLSSAHTRATLARGRADRIAALAADLTAARAAWEPARAAFEVADRIATLATGRSADNTASLALAAYVVSWRLGQVASAANARLGPMTAQRYALEQRGSGLELLVRDEWSGERRDPGTLSGGETFLVSLSLALGLADVVLAESAADGEGSDLETLFVDEGFGALDADTLDDVMAVLDDLRDGGRVVGVVSHVAELRTRISTQLHVTPSRTGSTVRIAHADA